MSYIDTDDIQHLIQENDRLKSDIAFLRQRLYDFHKKSWFSVYEENLHLVEEMKTKDSVIEKIFNLKEQYYQKMKQFEKENKHLEVVIKSVQTFIDQYSK
jgi:predicted nuclease with TOPRIM domain